ncbi:YncE family protein [Tautonia sociabilis]|uniref:Methanethiol oxidase n=1 Tax=Tautonia sociabilis TaxID=2080755 RepID=A0A432MIH7_9BACT|nr:hypothetical protein [Tautonia sociabilis]RUL87030.1 hypothetical protein TsocGM_14655 [Tautonia sociabilis]
MGATAVVAPFGRLVAQEASGPGEQRTKDRLIGEYLGRWICLLPTKLGGGAHAYDMATGKSLAWISYWNYGDDCPISHHLAAFPSPDPYKGFEFINSNQGGKNLLMWGIPTPVTEPGEGFKIYRVKYDGQQMGVVEDVSKTTGLGLGVHTTIAPDAESYAVADGQKDVLAVFDRATSEVLAAYFFDWEGRDKALKGTWVGGGTMTIKRIYPDPETKKFDLEGTKGIKMDWEMPPGGELQVEEGKIPGARLANAVGCDGVVFDPRGRWAVASIRLLGLSVVLDRRNEYEPVAALHTPKGSQLHYDVLPAGEDTWRVAMDRVLSPAHEAGFSPSGEDYVAMNNLRQNNVAVVDARDADPRRWEIKTHIEHPMWSGRVPIPFHVAFNPDGTKMFVVIWDEKPRPSHLMIVDARTWRPITLIKDIGPDVQPSAVTYDGKYVFTPFSGFQRLASGICVTDAVTNEHVGYLPSPGGHHDCVVVPRTIEELRISRCTTI